MGTGDQSPPQTDTHPHWGGVVGGDAMRDAQADVPSAEWLRAQLAFKNSMVHGILQFTPSIAFCYVLHRCVSRDIRCRESFMVQWNSRDVAGGRTAHVAADPNTSPDHSIGRSDGRLPLRNRNPNSPSPVTNHSRPLSYHRKLIGQKFDDDRRRHEGRAIRRVIMNHRSNGQSRVDLLSNKCILPEVGVCCTY
ncbi:hypothetical protein L6452_45779 [Arctium lappa]|nr:hypothetical protein L6452_45779 [Arctium lappa]